MDQTRSHLLFSAWLIAAGLAALAFAPFPLDIAFGPIFVIGGAGWLVNTLHPPADGRDHDQES